jgi:hypothetical protein
VGRHIAALVAQHTREQNRLHVAVGSQDAPRCVAQDLKRSLISLERRIVKMRPEAMALVRSDAEVGQRLLSNQVKKRRHVKDTITITMCASGRYEWPSIAPVINKLPVVDSRAQQPYMEHKIFPILGCKFGYTLPTVLNAPPSDWMIQFQTLAAECGLQPDLAAAFERMGKFYEEALADGNAH